MSKILGFITGPIGILIGKGMMIMTIIALIYSAVSSYNRGIADEERLKNQNAQLEQLNRDNQELRAKEQELEDKNRQILEETRVANDRVVERHTEVRTYLQSDEARSSNREASPAIKNTIRMLRDEEQQ